MRQTLHGSLSAVSKRKFAKFGEGPRSRLEDPDRDRDRELRVRRLRDGRERPRRRVAAAVGEDRDPAWIAANSGVGISRGRCLAKVAISVRRDTLEAPGL